ncbi:MAG: enoyl-ACP reductase FabI [Nitrospiraceae bacterium]|nr:enoyl-ACP reductase FabI [Nitrospiraceae bacterium]
MGILEGKRILITGVLNDQSLAFATARVAQAEGAQVLLTGFGRGMSITQRVARKLDPTPDVIELDVTVPEHFDNLAAAVTERFGALDGVLHSIGFAPAACLDDDIFLAGWEDVATALQVSAYSLAPLVKSLLPLLEKGSCPSVIGLDFDATVAWPGYNWMGVAKAALESLSRYMAREAGKRGVRVNLVSAGPMRTIAAKSVPGFSDFESVWDGRAPLGWTATDPEPVARSVVALLSDFFPATTGELIHVDGGFHAIGA